MKLILRILLGMFVYTSIWALDITGAGASFPAPLYMRWAYAYEKVSQDKINYQSIGSGAGVKQIKAKTVDFAASDMPLSSEELKKFGLMQFPTIIGGVVPVINLDGIAPGDMKLTGYLLAEIFLGHITQWNDEKIRQLNPDLTLPELPITVVHRADGSGTTFLLSAYFSKVNPGWKQRAGANTTIAWPVGVGGKGNEGISAYVQRIKGSIGYVEYAYVFQNKLVYTRLQNKEGIYVAPGFIGFKSAAETADWAGTPGFSVLLVDQAGKASWPITGASFILVDPQSNRTQLIAVLKFFDWSYQQGQQMAESLYYVPLPTHVITQIKNQWASYLIK